MMDEIKQLVGMIKELPDIALYILCGFAVYKTFIFSSVTASVYYGFKLAVTKFHDYATTPKKQIVEHKIADRFIVHDGTYAKFKELLDTMVHLEVKAENGGRYIHHRDLQFVIDAILEKKKREKKAT